MALGACTDTQTHTLADKSDRKKPGTCQPQAGTPDLKSKKTSQEYKSRHERFTILSLNSYITKQMGKSTKNRDKVKNFSYQPFKIVFFIFVYNHVI